jgi:hypothetical protein
MEGVDVAQADKQHREPFDLDLHAFNAFLVSMSWYSFVVSFEDRIALHKLVSIPGPTEPLIKSLPLSRIISKRTCERLAIRAIYFGVKFKVSMGQCLSSTCPQR